jgi:hypothetical protein
MLRLCINAGFIFYLFIIGGCSTMIVTPPPEGQRDLDTTDCTSDNWAPAIDLFFGTAFFAGAAGLFVWSAESEEKYVPELAAVGGIMGVVFGLAHLASAAYGFDTTEKCREAISKTEKRKRRSARIPSQFGLRSSVYQQPAGYGCVYDTQCKGDRICVNGQCVDRGQASGVAQSGGPVAAASTPATAGTESTQSSTAQETQKEVKRSISLGRIIVYITGIPAQPDNPVSLRFVRVVAKSKFKECEDIAITADQKKIELSGIERSSEPKGSVVEESVQVAIAPADLETIAKAHEVSIDVCGQKHALDNTAHQAFRGLSREFNEAQP